MLGRTANDLFWLSRYIERAECMARMIEVGYWFSLLPRDDEGYNEEWRSTLVSAGCDQGYNEKYDTITMENAVRFLLFDEENPSSVRNCLLSARRNARAQRTAITTEMWECLNQSWLEFTKIDQTRTGTNALPKLLTWVKQCSALYRGTLLNTVLKNDTFYFSQIGTFIERANNTTRILDVKYYLLLPQSEIVGGSVDNFQWAAILRSVSAHRSYRWVYKQSYQPWNIAEYLILNSQMPRSLRYCYESITGHLMKLNNQYEKETESHTLSETIRGNLADTNVTEIFQNGLHEFLMNFSNQNADLSNQIASDYHFTV